MRHVPPLLLAAAVLLGGCGGGGAEDGSASDDATVSITRVDGVGDVLVDGDGAALYASEQESSEVRCVDGCAAIWIPLTVEGEPVAGDGVDGALAVVERPDGMRQVTYEGKPLYSFVEDTGDGTVTGNGLSDDFDGTAFTWHVMTPAGPSASDANSEKPAEDGEKDPYGGGYER